ncbi:glutamate--tRNA ligase family protein, partial [Bacillus vallismortis]|nr:glutamate--tRNA ligase family protein [Bacillus vallismortis]
KHRNLTQEEQDTFIAEGSKPSIRFRVPEGKIIAFNDIVKGEITFETDGIGVFVIVKKDGTPTYNFAVAIDDYFMKMTHVLRGEDHISNTPKQIMIY